MKTPGSFEPRGHSWRWRLRRGSLITVATGACEANALAAREAEFPAGRFVYFIALGDMVKVGWSDDVAQRQRTLELATGLRMQLLCVAPGGLQLEAFLHDCFRECRGEGEWFRNVGPVARAVAALTGSAGSPHLVPPHVMQQMVRRLRKKGIAA